jgi:tyrosinase
MVVHVSIVLCAGSGAGCGVTNLEQTHGTIHVHVGGSMAMVPSAAKDPIFMMHHANIDRILQAWQGINPTVWFAAGM